MLTALIAGSGVVIAAACSLTLLLVATAAPVTASGRRTGAVPLVAPRGSGFGDATVIVATAATHPVAAVRTAPTPRPAAHGHRWARPAVGSTVHLAA